eukprot:PhM_4_TR18656/c0_g2_i4/m.75808
MNVVHRDIKPQNVLLSVDGKAKLSDFGSALQYDNAEEGRRIAGTALYMAPEQAAGKPVKKSDIWSLGIMVVELLTGTLPFLPQDHCPEIFFIRRWEANPDFIPTIPVDKIPEPALSFVELCLQRDAEKRPSASELLMHAFIVHDYSMEEATEILNLAHQNETNKSKTNVLSDDDADENELLDRDLNQLLESCDNDRKEHDSGKHG